MEHLFELLVFLAKIIIIFGGLGVLITSIMATTKKVSTDAKKGVLSVTMLNKHFTNLQQTLENVICSKKELKKIVKDRKKNQSQQSSKDKNKLFVIDFKGDIKASAVESLREEITAILSIADPKKDSVAIKLESGGGMVNTYGLAASQIKRLINAKISTTAIIDKVAGSGGYLMACTANKIVAAPFSIIGSIGVVATLPNINKLLTKNNIDVELHTSGEFKRTLTVLGKNTEKGRKKFIEDIQEIHTLFKNHVSEARKNLDIEAVSTGEIWLGTKAIEHNLIDKIGTSDEYLYEKSKDTDIFQVKFDIKTSISQKLGLAAETTADNLISKWFYKLQQRITHIF